MYKNHADHQPKGTKTLKKNINGLTSIDQATKAHKTIHGSYILQGDKNDDQSTFMTHERLTTMLGQDTRTQGYIKTRIFMEGKRRRGYWIRVLDDEDVVK